MSPRETWEALPTVWRATSSQDDWQDGMRTLLGNNWQKQYRFVHDELHDGQGGALSLALAIDAASNTLALFARS
jgi:hypothetical protein